MKVQTVHTAGTPATIQTLDHVTANNVRWFKCKQYFLTKNSIINVSGSTSHSLQVGFKQSLVKDDKTYLNNCN